MPQSMTSYSGIRDGCCRIWCWRHNTLISQDNSWANIRSFRLDEELQLLSGPLSPSLQGGLVHLSTWTLSQTKEKVIRTAFYVRVSTERQQQAQTIEQQVAPLRTYVTDHADWVIEEHLILRDDGHTGAKPRRPGLDALRDQATRAAFDVVLIAAPDRLARNYVHQMVILEELERQGISVVFIDRPRSDDPHEQLVLQIRGAGAEYEISRTKRCTTAASQEHER